ncbi:M14 family metallopeptidase [Flavobacteriaceae bacterium 14752]|uniref:M14 family metallopeptidase n=1 Tax=Mesohalobacter salilacus TaxID=2491711 RepID=UPI000F641380|nr:zinc carboxypeptidase [Flavobacteriaceae bacterium 14752]
MLRKVLCLFVFSCLTTTSSAQNHSLDYFLPDNVSYNSDIPIPSEALGFVPGDWHISHDKLIQYMYKLAETSNRIQIENRGFTYEKRPLILLTISSQENLSRLDEIKAKRQVLIDDKLNNADFNNLPIVVNQGFSVHGNEPSGANAAVVLAYYLAATEGKAIETLLNQTVILLDPSFNPDGIQRFAHWTNSNRSLNVNPDPRDREFDETWPGGRTNHYWFDLNRDWLPVQLPESQARIRTFYEWRPNILTDHHEMGSNSTFFFQPGIPQRTNPLTPQLNQDLTEKIGNFHAKALDSIGSLYYSKESFDDFYYGKGSTFPDVNGSIGILFEQASSRGSAQETVNGILEFKFTIKNQFTTALSTLKAAQNLKKDILKLQDKFYHEALNKTSKNYYVFAKESNPYLAGELHKVLHQHQIQTYDLAENLNIDGQEFKTNQSIVIPAKQAQAKLIKAMFESRTSFKDSIFYDVSAWDFNYAFGVDFAKTKSLKLGAKLNSVKTIKPQTFSKSNYAYTIRWSDFNAPQLAYKLQDKGLRIKVARRPFQLNGKTFDYGTLVLPVANQKIDADGIYKLISKLSQNLGVEVSALSTGLTSGINLGSPNMRPLKQPKIALMVGEGIRSYDAGEIWHLLDTRLEIPVTKLDTKNFRARDLEHYTHLIIPSSYGAILSESQTKQLKSWVRQGGTIIGYRNTINWLNKEKLINLNLKSDSLQSKNINFENRSNLYGSRQIGGAIFEAKIDRTHPINFGYDTDKIALFRNTELFIKPHRLSFNNPIQYTKTPLLSGYINNNNLKLLKESVPFQTSGFGRGQVIVFTDNTNFRGFWLGSMKLLMNSIYFSNMM